MQPFNCQESRKKGTPFVAYVFSGYIFTCQNNLTKVRPQLSESYRHPLWGWLQLGFRDPKIRYSPSRRSLSFLVLEPIRVQWDFALQITCSDTTVCVDMADKKVEFCMTSVVDVDGIEHCCQWYLCYNIDVFDIIIDVNSTERWCH